MLIAGRLRVVAHQTETKRRGVLRRRLSACSTTTTVLPSVQLSTSFNFSPCETIIQQPASSSLQTMPAAAPPPLVLFKHVTAFIREQTGSQTQKQLLPALTEYVSKRTRSQHTEHDVSELIRKSHDGVRRFRLKVQKRKTVKAQWEALQERLKSSRLTPTRRAAIERDNAHVIAAHRKAAALNQSSREQAEERLVQALGELKEKCEQWTAETERQKEEEKKRKKVQKQEERAAKEEKAAAEREEKKQVEQEKREREAELRARQTDVRAMQALDAKARQLNLEKERVEEAERRKRIDGKVENLLDLLIAERQGKKRRKREEAEESESDKENQEPNGEWRV